MAIETSSRSGGVALGRGGKLLAARALGPSGRHAGELLPAMDALLRAEGLCPRDVRELYVSVGPGSFTGLRVGVTTARTWGQMLPGLRIVAVPTALAVAEHFIDGDEPHLGVLLAAKEGSAYATRLERRGGALEVLGAPAWATPEQFLAEAPRPITVTGEALEHLDVDWPDGVRLAPREARLPSAEGVWRAGRRLAEQARFTPWNQLLPIYARRPKAVRLWERKNA